MSMQNDGRPDELPIIKTSPALLSILKLEADIELPAAGEPNLEHYLFERYVRDSHGWQRNLYYSLKPLIPRSVQLALRRKYSGRQAQSRFPAWPIEMCMIRLIDRYLAALLHDDRLAAVHRLGPWPAGHAFAFAITHDVEWDSGLAHAPALSELERSYGFSSSWNLVPERYPIDWRIVERLRSMGCEIGIHGLHHDGKLFQSWGRFRKGGARINEYARAWNAAGFRSESTLRNADWMHSLAFEYDSSFPDTDPYEPQAGGCCSIWPYFIGHLIELPITLPQDHTLFEILGYHDIAIWREKADWIEASSGLALLNVHPDYIFVGNRLHLYEEFLGHMRKKEAMWHALPRAIARWWRDRDASVLRRKNDAFVVEGPAATASAIVKTTLVDGTLKHSVLKNG